MSKNKLASDLVELTAFLSEKLGLDRGFGLGGENGYGVNYENNVFMMHQFCWCERDDCGWCSEIGAMPQFLRDALNIKYAESERLPNFFYKPTGAKVWWYKWIGRSQETIGSFDEDWLKKCKDSIL